MKHQLQIGTERGIVSREAVKQIRILITDLARTVQNLDADIVAEEMRPGADDLVFTLDTRRHNLMVTIASLEDRLDSIEKMRSRGYGNQANSAHPRTRAASPRSVGSSIEIEGRPLTHRSIREPAVVRLATKDGFDIVVIRV